MKAIIFPPGERRPGNALKIVAAVEAVVRASIIARRPIVWKCRPY